MKKVILFLTIFFIFLFPIPYSLFPAHANHLGVTQGCTPTPADPTGHCGSGLSCQRSTALIGGLPPGTYMCFNLPSGGAGAVTSVFGKIIPPQPIINLGFGAIGVTKFLNNLITLIYIISIIVFVFMIVFSGVEWLSSGGDKEKVANAQRRLTHAFIGIVILSIAFPILRVVGVFTGFTFFR